MFPRIALSLHFGHADMGQMSLQCAF